MQKQILILIGAITCAASAAVAQEAVLRTASEQQQEGKKQYTCPMHPEVVTDHPGNCPKCGMELVPLKPKSKRPLRAVGSSLRAVRSASEAEPEATSNAEKVGAVHRTARGHQDHSGGWGQSPPPTDRDHPPSNNSGLAGHHEKEQGHDEHEMQMSMHSSVNIADPMSRESSGTAWVPDSTPMYGHMSMFGDDMLMLHGAIFPRYTNVSTRRGDDRIDAPNWIMAMYSHPFSDNAQLGFRAMMSLDPLTEGGRGYPLLFQSGESWHDQPLHDRQHPHDLFDELSVTYSQKFAHDLSSYLYFGYPGEPALGPPTFMHRLSAMDNPDAPIGHHWQDSTHVTFGVATAGLVWSRLGGMKVEGSAFTGREPDENRYDFDKPRFDSFSGRVSWNPMQNLALQVSHGYIKGPEDLEPDVKRHRTTASLIYNQPLGHDRNWSNSFVWGQNNDTGEGKTESFLLETNYQRGRDTVYARWERVEKSGHELVLREIDHGKIFAINAATIGYVRDLSHGDKIDIGLGGQFTLNVWPGGLDRYYGDGVGYGFQVFLRIRPSLHSHGAHDNHEHVADMKK